MLNLKKSLLIAVLMLLTAVVGNTYKPDTSHRIVDYAPPFVLKEVIPKSFSNWVIVEDNGISKIISPEQKAAIQNVYDLTLSRTYINQFGDKVMLSIAYAKEQIESKSVHHPEACYPAQGFQVHTNIAGTLNTTFGPIRVRRLTTSLGSRREPITYWVVIDNEVVLSRYENRMVQVKYGILGLIPDGLLFRISSISTSSGNSEKAFNLHRDFADALLTNIKPKYRLKLSGLK